MNDKPETPTGAQKGLRTSFFAFTTTRPVAITMVVIAVAVFGLVSYQRLSLSLMPDISYPSITVRTEYPGTAPEEIETVISRPIEQALGIVSGLVSISSISRAGISDVVLEFSWDTDLDDAISQIREKLDRLYFQPEIKKPLILRYDPSLDPIVRLALYGVDDLYILRYIAEEEIERELEKLPGVAAVRVKGGLEEEIIVELDEGRLSTLNIGLDRVAGRLAQENINMAGGRLWEGQTEYLVRTLNEFKNLEEISDIVVETRGQALVRVRDLGRVYRGHKEREVITRAGGTESVEIEIYKEADANVVAVAEAISRRIYGSAAQKKFVAAMEKKEQEKQKQQEQEKDEKKAEKENEKKQGGKQDRARGKTMTDFLSYSLPDSVQIRTLFDQSVFIKNSIDEVRNTAVLGGLLAIIVLFIFLRNLPSTLIVSIAIPVSIIATFAPMYLFDVSLNIMSLGGLALGVGMLVDNSIVVLESIFRCRTEGDDTARAAVRGTGEVGGAVLASTLTTIAVFFPIVFVEGIAGQIFGDMSLTVVFSLLASLLVALFVIPMLASRRLENGSGAWRLKSVFRPTAGTSLARIKNSLETPGTAPGRRAALAGAGWLKILALEASALVWKPLYAIAAAVVSVIKGTLLVLAAVPLWLIALKTKKLPTRITALAGNHTLFGRDIFSRLWPGIICFQAPGHTLDSQQVLMGFLLRGGTAKRITKWLVLFLPAALYQVVFLVLALALETAGKLLMSAGFILGMALSGVLSVAGLLLIPLFLPLLALFNLVYPAIESVYPRLVGWALGNRLLVTGASLALFLLCWYVLIPDLGRELIPEVHQGQFDVQARLPVGTPLAKTDEYLRAIEARIGRDLEVTDVSTIVGVEKKSNPTSEEGEHTGRLRVNVKGDGNLADTEERVIARVRDNLAGIADLEVKIARPVLFSFKTPIEVEIKGYDLGLLRRVSEQAAESLSEVEGLFDVRSNIQPGNPEIIVNYDRDQLARHQLDIKQVADLVRGKVHGLVPTRFSRRERKIDIRVRVREQDKSDISGLGRLKINPGAPVLLPLNAVASLKVDEGPNEIRRIDQQRCALITANVSGTDLGSVVAGIEGRMEALALPADFAWEVSGQSREMEVSSRSLMFALALAIFLVYVVMASQFESLVHPLVIIFSIPLALIGVVALLWLLKIPVSVVVFIGLIMLAGIVVNNAIVLVDYINHLRRGGLPRREAIVKAGTVRLRPILMTTATTVLGLLPMALGLGEGAEIRTPMALTVIAGLISSTLLTLVVIPTVYDLMDWRD